MNKQMTQPTRIGQMAGTQIKIAEVHNDALRERVSLVNRGKPVQTLGGWARDGGHGALWMSQMRIYKQVHERINAFRMHTSAPDRPERLEKNHKTRSKQ